MPIRPAIALVSLLLVAATPAPTLVQHADNVLDSMQDASDDLATLVAAARATAARMQRAAGQAEILALHGDATRIARSCEALDLKAARVLEIAQELETATAAAPDQ